MASWRFKASKYKNAAPITPRKEECLSDIKIGTQQSYGTHINASGAFVAYVVENRGGGSVGVVPLGSCKGRYDYNSFLVHGHSDGITDLAFSPFHDGLLATCSADCIVKLWHIPKGGLESHLSNPEVTFETFDKRCELVNFHPTVESLLTICCGSVSSLWDISTAKSLYECSDHGEVVQGLSWSLDGKLLSTISKDKYLRIIDPRADNIAAKVSGHGSPKDSKVRWLSGENTIITSGFSSARLREVKLRDVRKLEEDLEVISFDSSTGVLTPLYDPDTQMLFLAGKGDVGISFYEIAQTRPYFIEGLKHIGAVPTKSACLVPKRGLEVMGGEVNRILQLTSSQIIPIKYQVPRKSYRDFHKDLYPDTASPDPALNVNSWIKGSNCELKKVSLNPSERPAVWEVHRGPIKDLKDGFGWALPPVPAPRSKIIKTNGNVQESSTPPRPSLRSSFTSNKKGGDKREEEEEGGGKEEIEENLSRLASIRRNFEKKNGEKNEDEEEKNENNKIEEAKSSPLAPRRTTATRSFRRPCKFRHLRGISASKNFCIENLRDLARTIPSESDGLAANGQWVAVPINGGGGKITIINHKNTKKIKEGVIPSFINGANVTDFAFDPYDMNHLAVGCDDGKVNLWKFEDCGLETSINTPTQTLKDPTSTDKVTALRFHPTAQNVLTTITSSSTSGPNFVKIWDVSLGEVKITLFGHPEQIFSGSWSVDGRYFATLCKGGVVRIFDPRKSTEPLRSSSGTSGSNNGCSGGGGGGRGGRVLWGPKDELIITTGFTRVSERQISIYSTSSLTLLTSVITDVSPAILTPHFDVDTGVLLSSGKGDSTIFAYEVGLDFPHLFPLTHHKCSTVHQGLVSLPKILCDVKSVEFLKMLRLTSSILEPLSFSVPRVKTEYFQDDIFPDTRVTWEAALTSTDWFEGKNKKLRLLSLQPKVMTKLSEIKDQPTPTTTTTSTTTTTTCLPLIKGIINTEARQKQHKLEESMSKQMKEISITLEQDKMEGVDRDEWED